MNYTTNFNLNKPEGTDLYNHLTIDNPNMDIIDGVMQANKLASVGNATELVSGTVHAITRSDSDQNIFKFKATGDFKVGDTITVDGLSVNAYTTDGQQLLDDAYVLSAEVLCILDGATLWLFTYKTPNASEVPFNSNMTVKDIIDDNIDETVTLTLNVPSGIVSNISGQAARHGKMIVVDISVTLTNGAYNDWVELGHISATPRYTFRENFVNESNLGTYSLRVELNTNNQIRIFHGNSGTYNIHLVYLVA